MRVNILNICICFFFFLPKIENLIEMCMFKTKNHEIYIVEWAGCEKCLWKTEFDSSPTSVK